MNNRYVEKRDEGFRIAGKRISLDSIVYAFRRGQSPESIRRSFPLLTLEEIYGAIAFYLAHQAEIDSYLIQEEKEFESMRGQSNDADWQAKMNKARQDLLTPQVWNRNFKPMPIWMKTLQAGVLRRMPEIDF